MDPENSESKKAVRICLNMIVRDEESNIAPCLSSVAHLIDAYAVIDTGSTDRTMEIIREFASAQKILGAVISRPWVDFAHNRTEALRHAESVIEGVDPPRENDWYVMLMDADDRASGADEKSLFLLDKQSLSRDRYDSQMRTMGSFYFHPWLIRIHPEKKWNWHFPIHEYIAPAGDWAPTGGCLAGGYIGRNSAGYRSKKASTFIEDASILMQYLKQNPSDPRATFYLAQSFRDAGFPELAEVSYQKRTALGGWEQEVYESLLNLGRMRLERGDMGPETVQLFLDAFDKCPQRLDAPYYLLRIWRVQQKHNIGWNFARNLIDVSPPPGGLFMSREIHEWGFFEEAGLHAYYAGDHESFRQLLKRVLRAKDLPAEVRHRTGHNLDTYGKIRVKLSGWWSDSGSLCERYNAQSKGNHAWGNIELTTSEDADYFVIFQHPNPQDSFIPERTIYFQTEALAESKPQIWGGWSAPDPRSLLQVRMHRDFPNCPDWHLGLGYQDLTTRKIEKSRLFSTIMTSLYTEPGHVKRIDFLKYYESQKDAPPLDIFGSDNAFGFSSYRGPLPARDKTEGLLPYKYTFHAENNNVQNYYTEKIVDPILAETLCFYWGCPNLEDMIDGEAFIRLDLDDPAACVRTIRTAVENDEWSRRLPAIRREKARLLNTLQFFPTLERILKEKDFPIEVINLDRRKDRWHALQRRLKMHRQNFTRFSALDGQSLVLDENQKQLFRGNTFGNRRSVLACALSHLKIWERLASDMVHQRVLVFEDDVELSESFGERLTALQPELSTKAYDVVFLGIHNRRHKRNSAHPDTRSTDVKITRLHPEVDPSLFDTMIGGTFAYVISREGAQKLLARAYDQGIKYPIDTWLMTQFSSCNIYRVEPHLVFSDYYFEDDAGRHVDSDIQRDLTALEM